MTLEEYAQIIGNDLARAHYNKDMTEILAIFKRADQTLESNNISPLNRREFWEKVREVIYSGRLLLEKQANSALIALMQAIEREIAARAGKAK